MRLLLRLLLLLLPFLNQDLGQVEPCAPVVRIGRDGLQKNALGAEGGREGGREGGVRR
jgi:hypothetical protein